MSDEQVKKYSLDSSAILQISKMYPADLFPELFNKIWEMLEKAANMGLIIVIDKVYAELSRKDDFAHSWIKARKKEIVVVCDTSVILKAAEIVQNFPKIIDPDSEHEQADPYLIAHAHIYGYVVVTAELKAPLPLQQNRKKDKIPNVCDNYNVEYIHTKIDGDRMVIEFFETLGIKLK